MIDCPVCSAFTGSSWHHRGPDGSRLPGTRDSNGHHPDCPFYGKEVKHDEVNKPAPEDSWNDPMEMLTDDEFTY